MSDLAGIKTSPFKESDISLEKSMDSEVDYDPYYVRLESWRTILHFKGLQSKQMRRGEIDIFLSNFNRGSSYFRIPVRSKISMNNNTSVPLLNTCVVCLDTKKTVFSCGEVPADKSVQLEFIKEGTYYCNYSVARTKVFEKLILKIIPSSTSAGSTPLVNSI